MLIDLRSAPPTFRDWIGMTLALDIGEVPHAPKGCAQGYLTLEDEARVRRPASHTFAPVLAAGVCCDSAASSIRWPHCTNVVSDGDRAWPDLEHLQEKTA